MSAPAKPKIPEPPTPTAGPGNLLSSVAPPTQLPNFVTATAVPNAANVVAPKPQLPLNATVNPQVQPVTLQPTIDFDKEAEKFSPAIPLIKGEPLVSVRSPEDSQATQSPDSACESLELEPIGDIMPGSGLFTWVKGAVSTGGILHRVAEKAKSSVDSMITTLDPQMREYLNSGGDVEIVVASDKEVKISPVREAFQSVFGKATVVGYPAQSDVTAAQPVGYAAAYAAAKQRIAHIRSKHTEFNNNTPVVAIESFLQESIADRWYEVSVLVLSRPSLGIELQSQSQGAALPGAAAAAARAATPPHYEHAQTGYSVTVGSIMADSLQVAHDAWHEAASGVSRREVLLLAARALAGSYKRILAVSAAET